MKRILNCILLVILLTASCTITKRVHRGGYHIEWHKRYNNEISTNENDRTNQFQTAPDSEILAKDFVLDEIENRDTNSLIGKKGTQTKIEYIKINRGEIKVNPIKRVKSSLNSLSVFQPFKSSVKKDEKNESEKKRNKNENRVLAALICFLVAVLCILAFLQAIGVILLIPITISYGAATISLILLLILAYVIKILIFDIVDKGDLRGSYKKIYSFLKVVGMIILWSTILFVVFIILAVIIYAIIQAWPVILSILIAMVPGILSGLVFFLIGSLIAKEWAIDYWENLVAHAIFVMIAALFYFALLYGLALIFGIVALAGGITYLIKCINY